MTAIGGSFVHLIWMANVGITSLIHRDRVMHLCISELDRHSFSMSLLIT